jgi:hypothetical protein
LTLGATPVDVDFVQRYKSLGMDLESNSELDHDGNESNPGSDESDSGSDSPSSSELSDLDNTGMPGIPVRLTCSFTHVTDDHPSKCRRHAK